MPDRIETEPARNEDQAIRPWSSLLVRDFRLIWGSSVLIAIVGQIRQVASLYQVYELSGSPFQLGLTGFFQALPCVLFGLFAGAAADAFDRKKLILVTYCLHLVPGLALGALTATGAIQVWHIYLLSLLGSLVEVFSWPARSAMIPRLVPPSHLMNAVTLNSMIMQSSFLLGPAIGGVMIDRIGLAATYLWSAALVIPAIFGVLGAPNALLLGSALGLLMIIGIHQAIPQLWRYRSE